MKSQTRTEGYGALQLTRRERLIKTPEGVTVPFHIATVGDRFGAFLIDFLIIIGSTIAVGILGVMTAFSGMAELGLSVALLFGFVMRNFYFIILELHWGGRTVGKRIVGLRVINRNGGPLSAEAVFARNLTRDLELFLPLTALAFPKQLFGEAPGWSLVLASAWLLIFAVLPFFSKDRLRVGDLIGGTLVVRAPASLLLPDLATVPSSPTQADTGEAAPARFQFTQQQLDIYGIHELQTLEDLLRRYNEGALDFAVLQQVCDKIKRKIDWPPNQWEVPVLEFLQDFYKAQRARLERKMLFGKRQERKTH